MILSSIHILQIYALSYKIIYYLPNVVNDTSFTLFNGCGLSLIPRFTMVWEKSEACKVSKCARFLWIVPK